ncbi:MAG: sigma-54-dependent Fis family transcriptional regulator [Desulfobacteraceae bacterium]|nr:MAG: sigma-54-dependent Fis family transcriptional regulator [Desulfobacteraceae bacterium]
MIQYSVWVVDDEESIRDSLELTLSEVYDIRVFEDAESFLSAMEKEQPDILLLDIGLPGINGIQALGLVKDDLPDIPVIMITAFEDINMVIESMKLGAFDFVLKPINLDILELTIKKAIATIALRKEVKILQEKYLNDHHPCFVGDSKNIENTMDFINMVSKSSDTPIMIFGETGTGKELIAKAIHARSPVFQGPFIAVNCSAIPEDLIESELFGYEEGAFTGARKKGKKGFIEEAAGGTLFLDEVADLSLAGQAKLLRFLESGEFYKVGGTHQYRIQTRVVSATNKNLESLIEEGLFRRDLFFRLCVVQATIPSLNERKEDIIPLAKYFLCEFNEKFNKEISGISQGASQALINHTFTGNVRELKNIMERAVLVAESNEVEHQDLGIKSPLSPRADHLPEASEQEAYVLDASGIHLETVLQGIEKTYMTKALALAKGNESQAARLLSLNHHTFRYRWKKHSA